MPAPLLHLGATVTSSHGGQAAANPFQGIRSLKVPARLPSFLLESEAQQLLDGPAAALPGSAGSATASGEAPSASVPRPAASFWELRDRLILELLYATGCRVSELAFMNFTDLDIAVHSIRVRGKGGKERVVFYGAPAAGVLREYLASRRALALARLCLRARAADPPAGAADRRRLPDGARAHGRAGGRVQGRDEPCLSCVRPSFSTGTG